MAHRQPLLFARVSHRAHVPHQPAQSLITPTTVFSFDCTLARAVRKIIIGKAAPTLALPTCLLNEPKGSPFVVCNRSLTRERAIPNFAHFFASHAIPNFYTATEPTADAVSAVPGGGELALTSCCRCCGFFRGWLVLRAALLAAFFSLGSRLRTLRGIALNTCTRERRKREPNKREPNSFVGTCEVQAMAVEQHDTKIGGAARQHNFESKKDVMKMCNSSGMTQTQGENLPRGSATRYFGYRCRGKHRSAVSSSLGSSR